MNALWIMDVFLYIMIGIGTFAVLRKYFPVLFWPLVFFTLLMFDLFRGIYKFLRCSFID